MHVQIVTFNLDGITEGDYIDVASRLAPRFASVPGLLAKVWLESPSSGTYGAIYFWDDEDAMNRFLATDLFEGTNPEFVNLTADDFSVLANLTRATQPVLTVLEDVAIRTRAPARTAAVAKAPAAKAPVAKAPAAKVPARKPSTTKASARKAPAAGGKVTKVSPAPAKARPSTSRGRKPTP